MNASRRLLVTPLATVKTRRQTWAYEDLIPIGVPTVLAGRGGIGKSTLLAWLASGLTTGQMPGDFAGTPVAVGFISGEDDPATTLVPRLQAAGANLELIQDFSAVRTTTEDGNEWTGLPTIAEDMHALRTALEEWGTKVLIIDPVLSLMSGDSIKASDVRRNLDPIAGLAAELGIAPILVMHFGKGAGNASDKVSGSHAFRDIARSVLLLAIDEETDQRILTVDKSNYSQRSPSLAFNIDSATVPTDEGSIAVVGHARLLGETTLTVHEIVRRSNDENILSDLSAQILEVVEGAITDLTTKQIVVELGDEYPIDRVRTYLNRLERSGRITRTGRGQYKRIDKSTVATVPSVSSNESIDTHGTSVHPAQCLVCGNPVTIGTTHPDCLPEGCDQHPNVDPNCRACETLAIDYRDLKIGATR